MAFPLIPLAVAALGSWGAHSYMTRATLESPDFVPRLGGGTQGMDARMLGIGAGVLGLLLGPAMPLLGSLGFGFGAGSAMSYGTAKQIQRGAEQFIASQAVAPPLALPGMMPGAGGGMFPGFLGPMFQGEQMPMSEGAY